MGRGKISINQTIGIRSPGATCSLLFLAGFVVFSPVAGQAQSAKKWDKRGQDAEVRQDYDTAYEDYRQATLEESEGPSLQGPLRADAVSGCREPHRPWPRAAPERRSDRSAQ